jgi:hypothetical protein
MQHGDPDGGSDPDAEVVQHAVGVDAQQRAPQNEPTPPTRLTRQAATAVLQPVKKFPALYGTSAFITSLTKAYLSSVF